MNSGNAASAVKRTTIGKITSGLMIYREEPTCELPSLESAKMGLCYLKKC